MPGYPTDGDLFKMGAASAVCELLCSGRFSGDEGVWEEMRSFLATFGVRGIEDFKRLNLDVRYAFEMGLIYGLRG